MIPFIVDKNWYERYWLQEHPARWRKGLLWLPARFATFIRKRARSVPRRGRAVADIAGGEQWPQADTAIARLDPLRIVPSAVTTKQ